MPTAHSHWLRGRLRDARVTVLLNGTRRPSVSGVVDQDITMDLHSGANTVTFLFQPTTASSAAELEIVESEHDPPIPPLVTFRGAPGPPQAGAITVSKPTTQTFTFVAN